MAATTSVATCHLCKNQLSIFPITQTLSFKLICGRCTIPNTEHGATENWALESTIIAKLFPCRYAENGCQKKFTPLEMKVHEPTCERRILRCPVDEFSTCDWKGIEQQLLHHCRIKHSMFFQKNNTFNVETTRIQERYILLNYEETVLLGFVKTYPTDVGPRMWLAVKKSGFNNFNGSLFAQATIKNAGRTLTVKVPTFARYINFSRLGQELDLLSVTDGASTEMSVKIDIIEFAGLSRHKFNIRSLRSELECSICCCVMSTQIFLCRNGHSLCKNCKEQVDGCPFCRSPMTQERNYALETLINLKIHQCCYQQCNVVGTWDEIARHQQFCLQQTDVVQFCPLAEFEGCPVSGCRRFLAEHLEKDHPQEYFLTDVININCRNLKRNVPNTFIARFIDRWFFVKLNFNVSFVVIAVVLNGPLEDITKFKFNFTIHHNEEIMLDVTGLSLGNSNKLGLGLGFVEQSDVDINELELRFVITQ